MADAVLTNGKEITVDLTAFTVEEYRGIFSRAESAKKSDQTLAKAAGITFEELSKLDYLSYKLILQAVIEKCTKPLNDPNSPSLSTSA